MNVTVKELLASYRAKVGSADKVAAVAATCVVVGVCALVARRGTTPFRWLAVVGLLAVLAAWIVGILRRRRLEREPVALGFVLSGAGPQKERVLRAFALTQTASEQPGVSVELALLHYQRTLQSIDAKVVEGRARGAKQNFVIVTLACTLASALAGLLLPHQVAEGVNVLLARQGVAPFAFEWLEYVSVDAKLPAYLGNRTASLSWQSAASLPEGSTLSVRGRPLHEGRKLVLWDGETEVPFVDDGEGHTVAHWILTEPVQLTVAARLGDTLIVDPGSIAVDSQADRLPRVTLGVDSRDILLEEQPEVEIRFRVDDDHQVSQVDLVLRALGREERRTLDRPAPGNRRVEGGYVLSADDPFLEKAFVPVVVRIEARDNKPDRGSDEWGKSESIILRPREVGSAQEERLRAIQSIRDALVDELASFTAKRGVEKPELTALRLATLEHLQALKEKSVTLLSGNYAGLGVPKGLVAFTRAQFEKAIRDYTTPGQAASQPRALERIILSMDAALTSLSKRDAEDVSKALGDVADEIAFAARAAQSGERAQPDAVERLDLAVSVLEKGARRLRSLGVLGSDLGSVAQADLKRVTTSRQAGDYMHAELAALHMAARLHRPKPSFGSKGGGGSAGVEGGDGGDRGENDTAPEDGPASDANQQFDRMARDLEELAQEHGQAVERSSAALDAAEQGLQNDALSQEAQRRAAALRSAARMLPQPGEAPSTSRASAALGREHSSAMAHELEDLNFEQAVENGQRARGALEEALRRGDLDYMTEEAAREALSEVGKQLEWATQQRAQWRAQKEQAAKEALQEVARYEQELGERARRLAVDGQQADHGLPQEAIDKLSKAQELMRHAARQLGNGEGQQGLNLQRHAQRLLEEAQLGQTEPPPKSGQTAQRGRSSGFGGEVPKDAEGTGARDFRRRVLEGLARSGGGRLAPAVKRYAEGLLR